jgi:hypothetical protein
MKPVLLLRRRLLFASLATLAGCDQLSEIADLDGSWAKLSEEDKALRRKFRGVEGGELVIDATYETKGMATLYSSSGFTFNGGGFAQWGPKSGDKSSFFGDERRGDRFSVPKTLRMMRYDLNAEPNKDWQYEDHVDIRRRFLGKPAIDITVPIASRIPDEVLAAVRSKKGGFRLKLRLHEDGLLVGWDLESMPSYDRSKPQNVSYSPAWTHTGGDFVERREVEFLDASVYPELAKYSDGHYRAQGMKAAPAYGNMTRMPQFFRESGGITPEIFAKRGFALKLSDNVFEFEYKNGEQVRKNPQTQWSLYEKGWYIHPKTKERIETDF